MLYSLLFMRSRRNAMEYSIVSIVRSLCHGLESLERIIGQQRSLFGRASLKDWKAVDWLR